MTVPILLQTMTDVEKMKFIYIHVQTKHADKYTDLEAVFSRRVQTKHADKYTDLEVVFSRLCLTLTPRHLPVLLGWAADFIMIKATYNSCLI